VLCCPSPLSPFPVFSWYAAEACCVSSRRLFLIFYLLASDFSDSVHRRAGGSRGYATETEYELLAAEERGRETPLQRLQRLRIEMQQLTDDVDTIKKVSLPAGRCR